MNLKNNETKSWLFLSIALSIFPISLGIIYFGYPIQGGLLLLIGIPIFLVIGINYEKPELEDIQ